MLNNLHLKKFHSNSIVIINNLSKFHLMDINNNNYLLRILSTMCYNIKSNINNVNNRSMLNLLSGNKNYLWNSYKCCPNLTYNLVYISYNRQCLYQFKKWPTINLTPTLSRNSVRLIPILIQIPILILLVIVLTPFL